MPDKTDPLLCTRIQFHKIRGIHYAFLLPDQAFDADSSFSTTQGTSPCISGWHTNGSSNQPDIVFFLRIHLQVLVFNISFSSGGIIHCPFAKNRPVSPLFLRDSQWWSSWMQVLLVFIKSSGLFMKLNVNGLTDIPKLLQSVHAYFFPFSPLSK